MIRPIYIPSKGRPDCKTARTLINHDILNFAIVIYSEDRDAYRKNWSDKFLIIVSDKSVRGLGAKRRWIQARSRWANEAWHWQIDDDVPGFIQRDPVTKINRKVTPTFALDYMQNHADCCINLAIAGTNQNAWPPSYYERFNDLPVQCVLLNNSCPINYKPIRMFEDIDFVLQVLSTGQWVTLMFDSIRNLSPNDHSRPGGMQGDYADRLAEGYKLLLADWPGLKMTNGKLQKRRFMRSIAAAKPIIEMTHDLAPRISQPSLPNL